MTFSQFKDSLLIGMATILVAIFGWIALSITDLNKNVAVVVAQITSHESRIQSIESRFK